MNATVAGFVADAAIGCDRPNHETIAARREACVIDLRWSVGGFQSLSAPSSRYWYRSSSPDPPPRPKNSICNWF